MSKVTSNLPDNCVVLYLTTNSLPILELASWYLSAYFVHDFPYKVGILMDIIVLYLTTHIAPVEDVKKGRLRSLLIHGMIMSREPPVIWHDSLIISGARNDKWC